MGRTDIVLAKIISLQSTMELCKWNERKEEVTLLGELKEQDKQLKALVSKVAVQSDGQIKEELDKLIEYIDKGTTTKTMPADDRDTFVKNVKTLNDEITRQRQIIEDLIPAPETTEVARIA